MDCNPSEGLRVVICQTVLRVSISQTVLQVIIIFPRSRAETRSSATSSSVGPWAVHRAQNLAVSYLNIRRSRCLRDSAHRNVDRPKALCVFLFCPIGFCAPRADSGEPGSRPLQQRCAHPGAGAPSTPPLCLYPTAPVGGFGWQTRPCRNETTRCSRVGPRTQRPNPARSHGSAPPRRPVAQDLRADRDLTGKVDFRARSTDRKWNNS